MGRLLFPRSYRVLRATQYRNDRIREDRGRAYAQYDDQKRFAEFVTYLNRYLASAGSIPVVSQNRRFYIINNVPALNPVVLIPQTGNRVQVPQTGNPVLVPQTGNPVPVPQNGNPVNGYPYVPPNASPFQYSVAQTGENQNEDSIPFIEGSENLFTFLNGAKAFIPELDVKVSAGGSAKLHFGAAEVPQPSHDESVFQSAVPNSDVSTNAQNIQSGLSGGSGNAVQRNI